MHKKVDDKIVAKDDSSIEIKEIETEEYEEEITTYNLTVEDNHTYLITELELLVHNVDSL